MRFPNLRYGNPTELAYYAMDMPLADLARVLRRDERTVRDWLSCRARVPWWVPEILRLKRMEGIARSREMNMAPEYSKLGIVRADVFELHRPGPKQKPQITDLRLSDFDPLIAAG
jgi:hypothetical protein